MTRRLALTIVGVVVTTLLLAGAGTLALAVASARSTTEADLRDQAGRIAANIDDYLDVGQPLDTPEGQQTPAFPTEAALTPSGPPARRRGGGAHHRHQG